MTLIGNPEPPLDEPEPSNIPDYLCDCPRDECPFCHAKLLLSLPVEVWGGLMFCSRQCDQYEPWMTVDENRIRYAAERLEDAEAEEFRYQTRKRGGEL